MRSLVYSLLSEKLEDAGYRKSWDRPPRTYLNFFRFSKSLTSLLRERRRIDTILAAATKIATD